MKDNAKTGLTCETCKKPLHTCDLRLKVQSRCPDELREADRVIHLSKTDD